LYILGATFYRASRKTIRFLIGVWVWAETGLKTGLPR
jgi:hypothetical protein